MEIPEGWKRPPVGKVFDIQLGKMLNKIAKNGPQQYPYLTNSSVRWGKFDLTKLNRMHFSDSERSKFSLKDGDLIVCEGGEVGRCAIWRNQMKECYYQKALHRLRPKDDSISSNYTYLAFEYGHQQGIFRRLTGQSSIAHLTREKLMEVPLLLPPLPEQKKIAEILSTWDRAIEVSEKLLENATTQKRALMQQLLTGKRRFPEFEEEEWREVRLHEIAEIIVSNVDKKTVDNEIAVRLCNYTDVYKNDEITNNMPFMEATATAAQVRRFGLKVGDVIVTKDSETPSDIAVPAYVSETSDDLVCGYHLAIIRPKNTESTGRFLKHLFELPHSQYYFGTRANGATRFGLTISSIADAEFRVPSLDEQIRISDVIVTSEAEISRYKLETEYLQSQKKALMQQLLTGKRRVKLP